MAGTDFIIAIAIFVMGAAAGLVAMIRIGIRHEERLSREERRHRGEQGNWLGPDGPSQFASAAPAALSAAPPAFSAAPPGLVCHSTRALAGLWIRRERGARPLAMPGYDRRR